LHPGIYKFRFKKKGGLGNKGKARCQALTFDLKRRTSLPNFLSSLILSSNLQEDLLTALGLIRPKAFPISLLLNPE
jgi:hypothetical protein